MTGAGSAGCPLCRANSNKRPSRMEKIRKLKAVRTIVRLDRREEYLTGWRAYAERVTDLGAKAWLFEDQALPGRFMEFTEFEAAAGMEGQLEQALRESGLQKLALRREGDDVLYREAG